MFRTFLFRRRRLATASWRLTNSYRIPPPFVASPVWTTNGYLVNNKLWIAALWSLRQPDSARNSSPKPDAPRHPAPSTTTHRPPARLFAGSCRPFRLSSQSPFFPLCDLSFVLWALLPFAPLSLYPFLLRSLCQNVLWSRLPLSPLPFQMNALCSRKESFPISIIYYVF